MAAHDITVRTMGFEYPDDLDPVFVEGDPEQSYRIVGLSLLLPYLEPYLIRTMKVARKHVSDPDLREDLQRFSAQEGQHYREHIRFNEVIRSRGFPGLQALEAELEADYRRWSDTRPLRFNLAYAEGFEALTTAAARFTFEEEAGNIHPAVRELLTWHAIEELEHRTVAFDVYQHVVGSYAYRLCVGTFAQWHLLRFIARVTKYMLEASPETVARHGGREGARRRARMRWPGVRQRLLPNILRTYRPGYTPHDIELTPRMREAAARYSQRAKSHY